jgi:hypothetical protein
MHMLDKGKRRGQANQADSFAALQLLHDPQTFAERLFVRLQGRAVRFETKLVIMQARYHVCTMRPGTPSCVYFAPRLTIMHLLQARCHGQQGGEAARRRYAAPWACTSCRMHAGGEPCHWRA